MLYHDTEKQPLPWKFLSNLSVTHGGSGGGRMRVPVIDRWLITILTSWLYWQRKWVMVGSSDMTWENSVLHKMCPVSLAYVHNFKACKKNRWLIHGLPSMFMNVWKIQLCYLSFLVLFQSLYPLSQILPPFLIQKYLSRQPWLYC